MKKRKLSLILSSFLFLALASCNSSSNTSTTLPKTSTNTSIVSPSTTTTTTTSVSTSTITREYNVYYKYEDGTIIDSIAVKENEVAINIADPVKDGYEFKGWYLENSDTLYEFNQGVISDIILIAKFVEVKDEIDLAFTDKYYSALNGTLDKNFKYNLHELI